MGRIQIEIPQKLCFSKTYSVLLSRGLMDNAKHIWKIILIHILMTGES